MCSEIPSGSGLACPSWRPICTGHLLQQTQTVSCFSCIRCNRDTVGTFEIAKAFAASKMVTCIHKHYSVSDVSLYRNVLGRSLDLTSRRAPHSGKSLQLRMQLLFRSWGCRAELATTISTRREASSRWRTCLLFASMSPTDTPNFSSTTSARFAKRTPE